MQILGVSFVEVSSSKILHIEGITSGRSFMLIRNKKGLSTDPCGTSELIFLHWMFDCLKQLFAYDLLGSF